MRSIALIALCLAAFGAVAGLVAEIAPLPPPPGIREKLRAFTLQQDETDVLFFGSSLVYRGVDPGAFDAAMREAGEPVRSFNFAMPSMRPHEANALLRHVLALRPARLRWVFLEWGRFDPAIPRGNWWKERPVFWHDAYETRSAIESAWRLDLPLTEKLELTSLHVLHFLQHVLPIGRGPAALRVLTRRVQHEEPLSPGWLLHRGFSSFTPAEHELGDTALHRRRYLDDIAAFEASLSKLPMANDAAVDPSGANLGALEAQIDAVRAAGAEPIYLVMPIGRAEPLAFALEREGLLPHLLAFNDPQRYRVLYRPDARFDRVHLSASGARELSRELARRFAAEIVAEREAGDPRTARRADAQAGD